ncbi:MAG TPA: hypothetical protein VFM11_06610 [Burkholderiales bacterium]|nr:hypothetical protein [Burkholderiales bacterium]
MNDGTAGRLQLARPRRNLDNAKRRDAIHAAGDSGDALHLINKNINREGAKENRVKGNCNREGAKGRKGKPDSNKKFFAAFLCAFAPLRLQLSLTDFPWRLGG